MTSEQEEANMTRLERLAVADLSRLDKEIAVKVEERAVVAEAIMIFRFARWQIVIAKTKSSVKKVA